MLLIAVCLLLMHLPLSFVAYAQMSPVPDLAAGKTMFMTRKGLHGFVLPWLGKAVDWTLLGVCLTAVPGFLLVGLTRTKKARP